MKPNETVVTSIMINNVSNLGVADISLYFEPSVVHVISATHSDFDVFYPVINNTGGIVRAGGMADLNNDKIVDIFDGATVGANWDHTAY